MSGLRTLAASLGLSITTVSRALDGHADVAPATRERVRAAAAATGYRPNTAARRLRRGATEAVTMVVPGDPGQFAEPLYLELLAVCGGVFDAAGLDLTVLAARQGADEMAVYRRLVEGRRTDGLIVARTRVDDPRVRWLAERGFPFVAMGRTELDVPYAHVDGDGEAAFRRATERLIALGHRRIAHLGGPDGFTFARLRRRGWASAMAEAGLPTDGVAEAALTEAGGAEAARALLARADPPTALLCATDRIAIGAIGAAAGLGLVVGRDLSVVGHDNLSQSAYTQPPLSTMELSIRGIGVRLAEMLIARIGGADPRDLSEIRPVEAIDRASVGPPPDRPRPAAPPT